MSTSDVILEKEDAKDHSNLHTRQMHHQGAELPSWLLQYPENTRSYPLSTVDVRHCYALYREPEVVVGYRERSGAAEIGQNEGNSRMFASPALGN